FDAGRSPHSRRQLMPHRRPQNGSHRPSSSVPALTLAVYHRSPDVEQHLLGLRQSDRIQLAVQQQTAAATPPQDASGLFWDLSSDAEIDRRHVSALIEQAPVASYGAISDSALAALSRTLGFRQHLTAPLRLVDVERALGLPGAMDLA